VSERHSEREKMRDAERKGETKGVSERHSEREKVSDTKRESE
jgi:hypothetical protein